MDAFIGEVRSYPYAAGRVPAGWLPCDGRLVGINQYQALYAVIGNLYGGIPGQTFGLPRLQGQAVVGMGNGPGLTSRAQASQSGVESVTLTSSQTPPHNHQLQLFQPAAGSNFSTDMTSSPQAGTSRLMRPVFVASTNIAVRVFLQAQPTTTLAPSTLTPVGGNASYATQPHENRQPALVMSYFICYDGVYPAST